MDDAQQSKKVHYGSDGAPGVILYPNPPFRVPFGQVFFALWKGPEVLAEKNVGMV